MLNTYEDAVKACKMLKRKRYMRTVGIGQDSMGWYVWVGLARYPYWWERKLPLWLNNTLVKYELVNEPEAQDD